jgi:TRAP-type mannitol/chloroaromatic compound transport system substrate-binding protein
MMGMGTFYRSAVATAVTAGFFLGMVAAADAAERVRWKMQSAFGSKLSIIGEVAYRFEGQMDRISGGSMKIKFFEPGALIPPLECFDSVAKGAIESCWTTAGYHTGKIPALAWFSAVPFGPEMGEYFAWLNYGGGDEIYHEIYKGHSLKALHSASIAPESSGWFRQKVNSVGELKGMKMRFFGLGARVMTKLGVSTQLLAAADIYPALERGVIDATEFSMPSIDLDLGFHQIAKFNYYPGWHQQASIGELLMNAGEWGKLDEQQKAMIETAATESIYWSYVRSEALQFKAMQELQTKGVTLVRWSDSDLAAFRAKWEEVIAEESAKDAVFKKTYESYKSFREQYKIWLDNGYLRK